MSEALKLRNLPTLLTDCVIVGHAKKADVVFTSRQWFAICTHMMNENPANFFLMLFCDENGKAQFKKAFRPDVNKRIPWAWDTITSKAKSPTSIGLYPTNADRTSRWAAIDFDAHDGHAARARDFALKAFRFLYQQPQLFVCLTTSAGDPERSGFHLFLFSREFIPCEDWTLLLKQVCAQIGAEIRPGTCEIFPDEFRGPDSIGKAIRAPGTWNPKTRNCGLIVYETLTKGLPSLSLCEDKESNAFYLLGEPLSEQNVSSPSSEVFRGQHGEWASDFAITAPCSRHKKLMDLVVAAFLQAGKAVVRRNAELQYGEAKPAPVATLAENLREFDELWLWKEQEWKRKLASSERQKFEELTTESERDAFRIIRNWSQTDSPDFYVSCESLGARLGKSPRGASKLRRKFCQLRILRPTAPYVPHKRCARFEWKAVCESQRQQSALISPSHWNGDPGDACLTERRRKI
jgi:hypothetical protein